MTRTQRALVILVPLALAMVVTSPFLWQVYLLLAGIALAACLGFFIAWVIVTVTFWVIDGEWDGRFWKV